MCKCEWVFILESTGQWTFFVNGQVANNLNFVGCIVSFAITQLSCDNMKTALGNTWQKVQVRSPVRPRLLSSSLSFSRINNRTCWGCNISTSGKISWNSLGPRNRVSFTTSAQWFKFLRVLYPGWAAFWGPSAEMQVRHVQGGFHLPWQLSWALGCWLAMNPRFGCLWLPIYK